jgi:hypothetical protein
MHSNSEVDHRHFYFETVSASALKAGEQGRRGPKELPSVEREHGLVSCTGSMSMSVTRTGPGEAPARFLAYCSSPVKGLGMSGGQPCGGLQEAGCAPLSGSSESAQAEIKPVATPVMRCKPRRREWRAAQGPVALLSLLSGGQDPGMPGNQKTRDQESVLTWFP